MQGGWGAMGAGAWGSKPQAEPEDAEAPPPYAALPPSAPASGQPAFGNAFSSGPSGGAYPQVSGPTTSAQPLYSAPGSSSFSTQSKEADLKKKEAQLAEKEKELKKLESELRATGGLKKKNWPICLPMWHHDIAGEIPEKSRRVVREVYMCWWGLLICLSFQVFCASVMLGYSQDQKVPSWFLAIVYWITGVPLSMYLWYRRLYNAARDNGTAGYVAFFLFFTVHIAFCIWAAIAVPFSSEKWSFTGFVAAMSAFDVSSFAGVIYIIGASLWTAESVWCIWCLKDTYYFFRGQGGVKEVQTQAAQQAALQVFKSAQGSHV